MDSHPPLCSHLPPSSVLTVGVVEGGHVPGSYCLQVVFSTQPEDRGNTTPNMTSEQATVSAWSRWSRDITAIIGGDSQAQTATLGGRRKEEVWGGGSLPWSWSMMDEWICMSADACAMMEDE